MTSHKSQIHPTVQRFAALTCVVALLPISIGALVTTLKAGMAFADWPTSDGQNMLLYPWLRDLRHTDKFVEHGHRLAGVVIGLVSIALVFVTFTKEKTRWVRFSSVAILVAVIAQGLLGGMRVRMNEQVLAMTHSITGGLFFTICFLFAIAVRKQTEEHATPTASLSTMSPGRFGLIVVFPLVVLGQYVLGAFFRHLGQMLHEHIAGAIIVTLLAVIVIATLLRTKRTDLARRGRWLGGALGFQLILGIGSWITKMGLPAMGWVATVNSPAQNIFCSLHTVGGMFLLATAAAAALEVGRQAKAGVLPELSGLFTDSTIVNRDATGGLA